MKIKYFATEAEHNAYTYRHIKLAQRRKERTIAVARFIGTVLLMAMMAYTFAQLFIGLN